MTSMIASLAIPAKDFLFKYLVTSTGGIDMNVNSSAAGVVSTFAYTVASSYTVAIRRVNVVLVDSAMKLGSFGGIAALTNGIQIDICDSGGNSILDFTDGQPIKTNEDWASLAGVDNIIHPAAGDDFFPIRWTIWKAAQVLMTLGPKESFRVILNDDLSGLTKFRIMIQGQIERNETDFVRYG